MRGIALVSFLALLCLNCGDSEDSGPGPRPVAGTGGNDPAFAVDPIRSWYLIGNDLTEGHNTLELRVVAPTSVDAIHMWLDEQPGVLLNQVNNSSTWTYTVDLAELEPGTHELMLAADRSELAFAKFTFHRSHPLYVIVSTDWENTTIPAANHEREEQLHQWHPHLRLNHFVGPYTFTDPTYGWPRIQQEIDWVTRMRDTFNDEIGVHIHPWCKFVSTTEVPCRTEPSVVYPSGDSSGYSVVVGAYTEQEFTTLLDKSVELFERYGLGRPTSFRAGGWTAEIHTLRALENAGFVADSSALNWRRMEEWNGSPPGATLYQWNQEHWGPIGDTSQPYYPAADDILSDSAPQLSVLEVPDNGILVDYVTGEEMIEIFTKNFSGEPLATPTLYQIGYHPSSFSDDDRDRIDLALDHVDLHLNLDDHGPAIYATLSELPLVWKPSE